MTFGERLFELRKHANLTQEQLAELLEVSRQSVSKWEQDKAYPEMTRLIFLSDYFQVSLDYLMRGTEAPEQSEQPEQFKSEKSLLIWQTFLSNLNPKQKQLFLLIPVLAVLVLILASMLLCYQIGLGVGRFIYYLSH